MNSNQITVTRIVTSTFKSTLHQRGHDVPQTLPDDMILLESGLDSLAFAILIAELEDTLGYDPFTLQEEPFYPRTFGEFISLYLHYSEHLSVDVPS